jgi:hypothetical protein
MSVRACLIGLRVTAVIAIATILPFLCKLMLWLPWQVDCALATTAAFAFAYKFEREESR